MKKTYQNPETTIVKVQTAQMIAVSTPLYGTDATSEAMGRRGGNVWDDDEDF